ncbi:MAG: hypothetical protein E7337_02700 [Clostridiales bacterium]|nr:hypothetical protein [Clostridiales bacterium]
MENTRKRRVPWAIVLLIVVFCCTVAYCGALIVDLIRDDGGYSYEIYELNANKGIEVTDDGFVYYDGSSISAVASDASPKWSYLIGSGADFDATNYGVAAWSGTSLTLIDSLTGTTTYSGNMETEVLTARIGEKYTAVLLGPEHDSTIVLMEHGGRRVNSITLTNQTVIDLGFFSQGSLMWVMSLDSSGTVPACTINTYRPGKEIVGSIHDTEQIMYGVVFQSSYFACAGDTYLKVYDYTGNEDKSRRRLVYGWYMAELDDAQNDPMMAFVPSDQYDSQKGMQDVRMMRANLDQYVRMPYGCQSLIAKGNHVYGFSTNGYVMIATQGQQQVNAYPLPMLFDKVYGVTADNVAIIGSGNLIYMMTLPNA